MGLVRLEVFKVKFWSTFQVFLHNEFWKQQKTKRTLYSDPVFILFKLGKTVAYRAQMCEILALGF